MTASLQRYFSAGVLTIWGVMLAYFYFSGRLASYLHPSFHVWTGISGVVLVLLAAGLLFLPEGEDPCCESVAITCTISQRRCAACLTAVVLVVPIAGGRDGLTRSVRGGHGHQPRFYRKNQRSSQLQAVC